MQERAAEKQEFAAILLYGPTTWNSRKERWTDAELTFIELYYQHGERLAETVIYRPRTGELGW